MQETAQFMIATLPALASYLQIQLYWMNVLLLISLNTHACFYMGVFYALRIFI
jgi:hypothetical protein